MASILARAGLVRSEFGAFQGAICSWNRLFSTSTRYSRRIQTASDEASETAEKAQKIFISPELKRDLLESLHRSEQSKKYIFDCLPEQESSGYETMMRSMFQELRKYQTPT